MKLALIGSNVKKSLSALIHRNISFKLGIDLEYKLISIKKEELKDTLEKLKKDGFIGFNVTIPYKEEIINYLYKIDESAKKLNAVNTVKLENGQWVGYNTDGEGFCESLKYLNISAFNKKIILFGAGGAAKGILGSILNQKPKEILVFNRSFDKLEKISKLFLEFKNLKISNNLKEIELQDFDIYINATSVGMTPNDEMMIFDSKILNDKKILYDIVYIPYKTKWLRESKHTKNIEGIYMLIFQAILAQEIWNNKKILEHIDIQELKNICIDELI